MQLIHARPHCDNGCWPGRWARWEMEGTLTKWSYYSLSGHRPWELFRSLLIRLSQKSKKYSLPVCVSSPQLPAVVRVGWQGNPGGEQKAELPRRWTATINDLTNFPPWPWITLLHLWCRWHYPPIMTLSCNFSEVLLQKKVASYRKPKSELNDCSRNVVTQMVFKRLGEVARIQGWAK